MLFFFCCSNVFRRASFVNVAKLLLVGVCIILLGMKSGYILLVVSIVYWIARSEITLAKRIGIVLMVCLASLALAPIISEAVYSILDRWMYFSSTTPSFMDFFSSGRFERIPTATNYLFANEENPLWFVFGVAMRYGECLAPFGLVEMDPVDIFFQYGLVGATFLLVYYGRFLFWKLPNDKKHYRFMVLVAFAMAVAAGHVLNSALSSMVFAILCCAVVSVGDKSFDIREA